MMKIIMVCPYKLGDALLTFPILVALRAKYTNVHITFVSNPAVLPLAQEWHIADEVREFDKHWSKLFSDNVVHRSKLRPLLQQTDLVLGWPTLSAMMLRQNLLEAGARNVIILKPPDEGSTHVAVHIAELAGVPPVQPENIALPYTGHAGFNPGKAPVALHPGCMEYRRWPASSFSALIDALLRLQYPVLLLGGPNEGELLKTVQQHVTIAPGKGMFTVLNNAPLLELSRQLKQSSCFVGHDTGTSHLAGMLGISTLVLFGPSNPAIWRPVGPAVTVIQQEPLSALSVNAVLEHVRHAYSS
ncbi:MAG TPA: glycosyltransferase family 9 protein [Ktedonobacteraceae bacterium]|nr:glycosyltransferase family 9 protein [Ktedonobacteraceae bacterium]